MAHTHAPAPSTSVNPAAHQRRLIATLTVTGSVFLIEVVSAVLTGSLALLVDAGQGTHKELLDNCDVYRQIAESQLSQSELTA